MAVVLDSTTGFRNRTRMANAIPARAHSDARALQGACACPAGRGVFCPSFPGRAYLPAMHSSLRLHVPGSAPTAAFSALHRVVPTVYLTGHASHRSDPCCTCCRARHIAQASPLESPLRPPTTQLLITAARASESAASAPASVPEPGRFHEKATKVISLGLLFFCSTSIYTMLQNLKDSIIVTSVGAEALPFLEAYGVLPLSVAFFVLYSKLNHWLPEKWVYQVALAPFLAFYAFFGFVLYPNAATLHPTHLLQGIKDALPEGLVGLAGMVVHWTYSLFFCLSELWGGVAISLLFWGLADEVCTVSEAESVYPLLGIIANIGLVLAGAWIKTVNAHAPLLAEWGFMPIQALIGTIMCLAVALFAIKNFVQNTFVKTEAITMKKGRMEKSKPKKTLGESLAVLKHSPKVSNLAVLVISYFVSQKLFDFAWKAQLRVMYPVAADCQLVLAEVAQWTGITTIVLMATSKFVFRYGGWAAAAVATPLAVLVTGGAFFASAVAMQGNATFLNPQVVAMLVGIAGVAGAAGRVSSRAPKYSLFDPAKEMVYITMSKEEKQEGKAAVDLLGSYFGKSGASWIMQGLVLVMGSLTRAMPLMGLVHVSICLAWTRSTFSLAALMQNAKKQDQERERAAAVAAAPPVGAVTAADAPAALETAALSIGTNGHSGNGQHADDDAMEDVFSDVTEHCEPGDPCVIHESMWDSSTPTARILQTPKGPIKLPEPTRR